MALSKHLQILISLFSLVALSLMLANKVHSAKETSFSFNGFVPEPSVLTYQGDAHVPSCTYVLRLTKTDSSDNPESWSVGRVLYSKTIQFKEISPARQAYFETFIRFVIKPSRDGAADGIAFFIAPVNTAIPSNSTGGNLGIFNSSGLASQLFAVEFDTFANTGWDPSYRHIGIDINSRISKANTRFDSATGQEVTAHIRYDPIINLVWVIATSGSETAELRFTYDLKSVLPQQVQVGISSATGQTPSHLGVHDIRSWNFTSTLISTDLRDGSKNEGTYIRQNVPM